MWMAMDRTWFRGSNERCGEFGLQEENKCELNSDFMAVVGYFRDTEMNNGMSNHQRYSIARF